MMKKIYLILILAVAVSNTSFISPLMSIMFDSCQNQQHQEMDPRLEKNGILTFLAVTHVGCRLTDICKKYGWKNFKEDTFSNKLEKREQDHVFLR